MLAARANRRPRKSRVETRQLIRSSQPQTGRLAVLAAARVGSPRVLTASDAPRGCIGCLGRHRPAPTVTAAVWTIPNAASIN